MWQKQQKLTQNQIKEVESLAYDRKSSGQEVRRAQAVLLLDKEEKIELIKRLTHYQRRNIFDLRKKYLEQGIVALQDKQKKNPKELLTKPQKEEVALILQTKTPKDFGWECGYWTTSILGHLIEEKYQVKYKSKTSFYLIFKKAKFTYHKPGRVYHKRDEQEVKEWQVKTKPIIKKALQDKNIVILTEDEMILSTQTTTQKIWLPQGDYPKIEVSNKKENRSIYGFLNIKTGQEHSFKTERQTMYHTKERLEQIRNIYPNKKLLLLWDGAGWHRGSVAQDFIKRDGNIEIIYFPRYSPEENPQEHVWKSGRANVSNNRFIEDIDKATDEFVQYLNTTKFPYSLLGS